MQARKALLFTYAKQHSCKNSRTVSSCRDVVSLGYANHSQFSKVKRCTYQVKERQAFTMQFLCKPLSLFPPPLFFDNTVQSK